MEMAESIRATFPWINLLASSHRGIIFSVSSLSHLSASLSLPKCSAMAIT